MVVELEEYQGQRESGELVVVAWVQYSTVQYSTVQYSTVHCTTPGSQDRMLQCSGSGGGESS